MTLDRFHPAVASWFAANLGAPTACQEQSWEAVAAGRHTLIAAPTGSGKTLAGFLTAIDALVRDSRRAPLPDATRVLYVSPLKALGNDVHKNLEVPLEGIDRGACRGRRAGVGDPGDGAHRRHPERGARIHAPAAAAHPGDHARVALHPAHERGRTRHARERRHRDHRRDPRRRRQQARRAPRALARAPGHARRRIRDPGGAGAPRTCTATSSTASCAPGAAPASPR